MAILIPPLPMEAGTFASCQGCGQVLALDEVTALKFMPSSNHIACPHCRAKSSLQVETYSSEGKTVTIGISRQQLRKLLRQRRT